ncbi:MAG: hypothetical protein V7K27_21265 [Nostoc sp.]
MGAIPFLFILTRRNADGKIEIFADESSAVVQPALTCAAVPKS